MTHIKSEKAKEYIESQFTSEYNDIEHYLCHYGEDGVVLEKGRIGRCRRCADKAVIIAETEAEERHAKELQELKDKAVDRANITLGAMILDGYEPEDSCVKYMQELIEELKTLK